MDRAPQTRILVAVVPEIRERIARVLAGHELTFVDTCDEAMAILSKESYGLVIVSVHFDESQMSGCWVTSAAILTTARSPFCVWSEAPIGYSPI